MCIYAFLYVYLRQVLCLFLQDLWGPRFFVPPTLALSLFPRRYDYYRPVPHHLTAAAATTTVVSDSNNANNINSASNTTSTNVTSASNTTSSSTSVGSGSGGGSESGCSTAYEMTRLRWSSSSSSSSSSGASSSSSSNNNNNNSNHNHNHNIGTSTTPASANGGGSINALLSVLNPLLASIRSSSSSSPGPSPVPMRDPNPSPSPSLVPMRDPSPSPGPAADVETGTLHECVICYNAVETTVRGAYLITPCDHLFHKVNTTNHMTSHRITSYPLKKTTSKKIILLITYLTQTMSLRLLQMSMSFIYHHTSLACISGWPSRWSALYVEPLYQSSMMTVSE